jgi:hypothetical protein
MDRSWLNSINRANRIDPEKSLKKLRQIEYVIAESNVPPKAKALRTNALKRDRELRDACLFCWGMSCRIGQTVWVYPREDSDFDFVAGWDVELNRHFALVQLKEVVPHSLNPNASLQAVANKLNKYPVSNALTVAIRINQPMRFDPAAVEIPPLALAALWVFGAASEDQSKWFLCGNMLESPEISLFDYPT